MTTNDKQTLKDKFKAEKDAWQGKIDEAKVQMHLADMEVRQKLEPYLKEMQGEWDKMEEQWEKVKVGSESALKDIEHGMSLSGKAIKKSFEKAKEHFKEDE